MVVTSKGSKKRSSKKADEGQTNKTDEVQVVSKVVNGKDIRPMRFEIVPIEKIIRAEYNSPIRTDDKYTKELMKSIADNGVIQPVTLTADYHLVDGHRRIYCSEKLGKTHVPAMIQETITVANEDDIYETINTTSRKLNEADQLFTYIKGHKVNPKVKRAIDNILEGVGNDKKILDIMFKKRTSPTHIWHIFTKLKNYANIVDEDNKKTLFWIAKHETSYRLRRAIKEGVSPKVIKIAITRDKPLKQRWMVA